MKYFEFFIYCNKILSRKNHIKICKYKYDKKQNELIELENKNKLENDILKNEIEQLFKKLIDFLESS